MNQINWQRELERQIAGFQRAGKRPSLLLHCCCAPCSSYVLEYLSACFRITVFYYNPNISPESEYYKRLEELQRLLREKPLDSPVAQHPAEYDPERFYALAKGLEELPEGGERCYRCYELRLRETAREARENGFDYFTTTLSISPYKNAAKLNEIGGRLGEEYGVPYLFSDFKKKGGYQRSIQLSREYGLYRQAYCGCVFSKQTYCKREEARETAGR